MGRSGSLEEFESYMTQCEREADGPNLREANRGLVELISLGAKVGHTKVTMNNIQDQILYEERIFGRTNKARKAIVGILQARLDLAEEEVIEAEMHFKEAIRRIL